MKRKISLLATMVLSLSGGSWWLWAIAPPSEQPTVIKIEIATGATTQAIATQLETAGIIRSQLALRIWLKYLELQGQPSTLSAGTFALAPNQSLPAIIEQIQTQPPLEEFFIIPEGWNIDQMATYFEAKGYFRATDFVQATITQKSSRSWLPKNLVNLEGFLFPETYKIAPDQATPELVINLMLDQFEAQALPLAPTAKLNLKDWVILASIVEKEAVLAQERDLIASVFWARLAAGMRLESDPTVEYGLKIKQTKQQPLTLQQVRIPSPYNTYLNAGLPPGAIASPGLASLRASLAPRPTPYRFFVARYDGSHIFSRTFAEHERAIRKVEEQLSNR